MEPSRSSDIPHGLKLSGSSTNPTDHPLLLPAPVQMIGEEGAFYRLNVESVRMNDPFTLVSIIGPQCSGKSYLLNHIFGTNFEVMNATKGRNQTTKGIWLSKSTIPNFLVLDVEGSDGKEKQDQLYYQRQIARFLLQLSNLIMVNMRLQDINRQLGGSSTLLPAIFQEKTNINSARTNILVVIRGYDNETPLDLLQSDVLENMKKLWKSSVPDETQIFEECIELFVVALADKSEEQDFKQGEIKASIKHLVEHYIREIVRKNEYYANSNAELYNLPPYNDRTYILHGHVMVFELKDKLAKGCFTSIRQNFASKANSIWQSVRQNHEQKIPVHDHMVATSTINCERTINFILDNLESFQGYDSLVASTSSKEFWEAYTCLSTGTSTYFDTETEMCDITVRNKKHQELKQTMLERVDPFHRNILTRQNQEMQEKYKEFITEQFRQAEDPMLIVDDSIKKCMEELEETCRYMSSMNKDAYHQFLESFESALRDFAENEAEWIKGKRDTAKSELARDEMARKVSALCKEAEALQQEVTRGKEQFNKDKEMARESLEQERENALASNQRAREDAEKEREALTKKLKGLRHQEERIMREKKEREERRFRMANQIARTMFTVAGGLAASFLGVPLYSYPVQGIPGGDGYQRQPIVTDVTGEHPEDNCPPAGDQDLFEECQY